MSDENLRNELNAYADGELDGARREAIERILAEHPEAARRVGSQCALKAAMANAYAGERAPTALRERIVSAIRTEAVATGSGGASREGSSLRIDRWVYRPRVLAIAASVALIASAGFWFAAGSDAGPGPWMTDASQAGRTFAADVSKAHFACIAMGKKHHHAGLPRDLAGLATAMGEQLHCSVQAPRLTRFGMHLLGADYCGLLHHPGAHVIYYCKAHRHNPVSLYSIPDLPEVAALKQVSREGGEYVMLASARAHIFAWEGEDATYVMCGECEPDWLFQIARETRVALADPQRRGVLVAAMDAHHGLHRNR
jgi:anti-sigma factor RsiW